MESHSPAPEKPRRWPVASLVACVNAVAGGALGLPVALWAMDVLKASRFEGSSDFGVAFIWTPLAIITGFVVGFVVSFFVSRTGFAGFIVRAGIAFSVVAALIAMTGGIAYACADHPPHVDGKQIEVEFELRVPTRGRSIEDVLQPGTNSPFAIRFMAGESFTSYAEERWSDAQRTEKYITILVRGALGSQDAKRVFTAGGSGESWQMFPLLLPPSPDKVTETWSAWLPPDRRWDGSTVRPEDRYWLRYRVQFAKK